MKKASEYRQHAEECRALARGVAAGPHREQLLEIDGASEETTSMVCLTVTAPQPAI